jgi:Outer membrane lipoprotein-sorting protein
MKMSLNDTHAKTQRRKETQMSKAQPFFAPLRLCVSICLLSFAVGATAETTNDLSDAEIQGRQLAQKIFELQPTENFTNTGVVKVNDGAGKKFEIRFEMRIKAELTNSFITYATLSTNVSYNNEELSVSHPNNNKVSYGYGGNQFTKFKSFANSDFSAYDLAMDFIYWPAQKILKKDVHRSRGCIVLESTNPNPTTKGYSRVVSWIDEESLGIVEAYAYDANGKLLKDFYPKDFKKVSGQWQVQTLVMENVQSGSRSRLEFDLNKP